MRPPQPGPSRKQGFSLVEVMVALAIALIVIATVTYVILASFNNYGRISSNTDYDQVGDGVYDLLRQALIDADAISRSQPDPTAGWVRFYVQNNGDGRGRLYFDEDLSDGEPGIDLLGDDYYLQSKLIVNIQLIAPDYLRLTVALKDKNDLLLYEQTSGFKLLNTQVSGSDQLTLDLYVRLHEREEDGL